MKILLDRGAKVNAKESVHGQTALMFAAALNRDAVVTVLLAHGADPNVATSVHKMERVRFDQDGNVVEDRPAGAEADVVERGRAQTEEADRRRSRSVIHENGE